MSKLINYIRSEQSSEYFGYDISDVDEVLDLIKWCASVGYDVPEEVLSTFSDHQKEIYGVYKIRDERLLKMSTAGCRLMLKRNVTTTKSQNPISLAEVSILLPYILKNIPELNDMRTKYDIEKECGELQLSHGFVLATVSTSQDTAYFIKDGSEKALIFNANYLTAINDLCYYFTALLHVSSKIPITESLDHKNINFQNLYPSIYDEKNEYTKLFWLMDITLSSASPSLYKCGTICHESGLNSETFILMKEMIFMFTISHEMGHVFFDPLVDSGEVQFPSHIEVMFIQALEREGIEDPQKMFDDWKECNGNDFLKELLADDFATNQHALNIKENKYKSIVPFFSINLLFHFLEIQEVIYLESGHRKKPVEWSGQNAPFTRDIYYPGKGMCASTRRALFSAHLSCFEDDADERSSFLSRAATIDHINGNIFLEVGNLARLTISELHEAEGIQRVAVFNDHAKYRDRFEFDSTISDREFSQFFADKMNRFTEKMLEELHS